MKSSKIKWVLLGIVMLLGILAKITYDLFASNTTALVVSSKQYIYVGSDKNYQHFIWQMSQKQMLVNPSSFERLANWVQLNKRLKPGRYLVLEGMSNFDIMKLLASGKQVPVDVVFNGANSIGQLAALIGNQIEADSMQLIQEMLSPALLHEVQMDSANIISLFVPNTYNFYWNTSAQAFVERLQKEYHKFWNEKRTVQAEHLGLSKQQVAILASIVQKESNLFAEMPLIAGVYLNRIKKEMPLQADPTLLFIANDPSRKRVTAELIAAVSPYNTYLNTGLPPGPICCPSVQAIDAVLNASKTPYYYFCAAPDFSGKHLFAKTLQQHNVNAMKYRRALNKMGVIR